LGRWFGSCGFRLGLLFLCLVDSPRVVGELSTRCSSSRCSSCSSQVLECFRFDPLWQLFLVGRSLADRPGGTSCSRTVRGRVWIVHFSRCATGGSVSFFIPSIRDPRTARPCLADRPPGQRGLSAWCLVELLSSLLLVFRFCFGIVWGLFLGLVCPL
jgi:hypothetical protein